MCAVPTPPAKVTVDGYDGFSPAGLVFGPVKVIDFAPSYLARLPNWSSAVSVTANCAPAVCSAIVANEDTLAPAAFTLKPRVAPVTAPCVAVSDVAPAS